MSDLPIKPSTLEIEKWLEVVLCELELSDKIRSGLWERVFDANEQGRIDPSLAQRLLAGFTELWASTSVVRTQIVREFGA